MKNYLINIIGCLGYLFMFPIGIQAQTLENYLIEASTNNPMLKASYAEFEASLKRVSQVNALPDPTISFGLFINPIETRLGAQQAKISLSQMFPWFGTLQAKEDVATFQAEAKYQAFLNDKNEVYFKVKKAYYPLYEIKQHIKWMKENLRILNTYKQLSTISLATGKGMMTDVIRVDIMLNEVKTDIQLLEDKLTPYTIRFNRLLNKPDSSIIIILDTLSPISINAKDRCDSLLVSNPMLEAMNSHIQASTAMIEVAKKRGMPQFGIGLDYAFISQRTDMNVPNNGRNAIMPMISMSIPIFREKYKASVEEAQLMKTTMEFKKENLENTLFSTYESVWYELKKAQQLTVLYQNQLIKTTQIIDFLYVSYGNSGKDFEEILQMQQQLLKYQIALATSNVKFYIALAQLDYITAKSE